MTVPLSNRFDSVASAGANSGSAGLVPVVTIRAPAASDIRGPYGPFKPSQMWVDSVGQDAYILISLSSSNGLVLANWVAVGGDAGGVLSVAGTANQITAATVSGAVTLSTPATFIAPGSIAATTTLTATLGAITATNGNFVKGTAGNKDIYSSVASTTTAGANSAGTVVLVGGTATISTTAVTASSLIRLYRQGIGATGAAALGDLTVGTITAGTSFVINSVQAADATALQATDVSVVFWEIVN